MRYNTLNAYILIEEANMVLKLQYSKFSEIKCIHKYATCYSRFRNIIFTLHEFSKYFAVGPRILIHIQTHKYIC